MANDLRMSYSDVEDQCVILDKVVTEFNENRTTMTNSVNILCDGWESKTSEQTRSNYDVLASSLDDIVEIVEKLKTNIRQYVADMQELDEAYAKTTVS